MYSFTHGSLIDNSVTRGQHKQNLQLALSFVSNFNLLMAPLELLCKIAELKTYCVPVVECWFWRDCVTAPPREHGNPNTKSCIILRTISDHFAIMSHLSYNINRYKTGWTATQLPQHVWRSNTRVQYLLYSRVISEVLFQLFFFATFERLIGISATHSKHGRTKK